MAVSSSKESINPKFVAHIIRDTFPHIKNFVSIGDEEHKLVHELRSSLHGIEAWHLDTTSERTDCDFVRLWPWENILLGDAPFFGVERFDLVCCFNLTLYEFIPHFIKLIHKNGGFLFLIGDKEFNHLPSSKEEEANLRAYSIFKRENLLVYRKLTGWQCLTV